MTSIVDQLRLWSENNAAKLADQGIELNAKIPDFGSNIPWKASIGLKYDGVLVSYTVWERTGLQTSLLVMNQLQQTIVMDEGTPDSPEAVNGDLEKVVEKLSDRTYQTMNPDKELAKH